MGVVAGGGGSSDREFKVDADHGEFDAADRGGGGGGEF